MALFQRIKTPFVEPTPELQTWPVSGPRSAGDVLRQRREELDLDLEACARALNIKPEFLGALEDGRPDRLPGPTYAIGFVRAYGDHLGLDGEALLRRFKAESAGLDAKPDLSFPMPLGERGLPGGGVLLVALILAICGYGFWYYLSTARQTRPERVSEVPQALLPPKPKPPAAPASRPAPPAATAEATTPAVPPKPPAAEPAAPASAAARPPAAASPPPAPAATAAAPAQPAPTGAAPPVVTAAAPPGTNPEAAPEPPVAPAAPQTATAPAATPPSTETGHSYGAGSGSRVVIHATADSWIQVRDADQTTLFVRVLKAGDTYAVPDRAGLSLVTGNAGGLEIDVNGHAVPAIGKVGAVLRDVSLDPVRLLAGVAVKN